MAALSSPSQRKRATSFRREPIRFAADKINWKLDDRSPPKHYSRTAKDVNALRGALHPFHDDELRRIPVLPVGSRLEANATYLDLSRIDLQGFTAEGNETVEEGEFIVPKAEVDFPLWNKLLKVEWKKGQRGPLTPPPARAKSKSMKGRDGERKLATGHGRAKRKAGGESQKKRPVPHGTARRTGSSKELK